MWRNVDVPDVAAIVDRLLVVDVRSDAESELGTIPGALHVPLRQLLIACERWPRHRELLIVCRSGGRSARAADLLSRRGFTRVLNLRGGMLAWSRAGLPSTPLPATTA